LSSPVDRATSPPLAPPDPEVRLMVPRDDVTDPEVTILVPALNEELTIGRFLAWCREGIAGAGCPAEILIVDSSVDRTPEIAVSAGARVLRTPRRGLGRAYIDAIPYVRGRYVILGDADCTYDFRRIAPFVEQLRAGHDYVMGSRFRGTIEPRAMPKLHRYFGTPVTTFILNRMFGSHFSDIHCGMRGIRREALQRLDLRSQSWQYASEMTIKALHLGLKCTEVPVDFYRDQAGRQSHMKRSGWLEPWRAGWQNLEAMFVYGVDFFVFRPGIVLLAAGLALMLPLTFGPIDLGWVHFQVNWMLLAMSLSLLGLSLVYFGGIVQVLLDKDGSNWRRWESVFPYNRSLAICGAMGLVGMALLVPMLVTYLQQGGQLSALSNATYRSITGLWLMIAGFQTFVFVLLQHVSAMVAARLREVSR
jgi:glycosyltransferase involved in cell wall biosynthesis